MHQQFKGVLSNATIDGADITGTFDAAQLTGILPALDGSAITNVNADNVDYSEITNVPTTFTPSSHTHGDADIISLSSSKLTGALPAIDGSNLTGINATPSTNDVASATSGIAAYVIGSYAAFHIFSTKTAGQLVSGQVRDVGSGNNITLLGTWRCMQSVGDDGTGNTDAGGIGILLRIS